MQQIQDDLYLKSSNKYVFTDLMRYITSEDNILLAYRNMKNNKGSSTPGTDGKTIFDIKYIDSKEFVKRIQNKFQNYQPKSVRRVEIPKPNGKKRPLGIPSIEDRIIQQCIKQIMEPICEARFHKHSYGFRPNRSTTHAVGRCHHLVNKAMLHYVVDVDIKGFFDNVDHAKLKKQIWSMGIHDKNLIAIIGKILKSEIEGIGIPKVGTPQGGILSPLLANIVLNELDWWISSQWETFETKYKFGQQEDRNVSLKKFSKLKEVYIVRYADDFKLFCRNYKTAQVMYITTRDWLKERLKLDISPDKSKITNLRRNYTDFLGIKFMAKFRPTKKRKNRWVSLSHMSNKSMKATINKLKEQIKRIKKHTTQSEVARLNSMILGMQNYYRMASFASIDFSHINFIVLRSLDIRLRACITHVPNYTRTYKELYAGYRQKTRTIKDITIFPIYGCRTKTPTNFNPKICSYTQEGRELIHSKLTGNSEHLIKRYLQKASEHQSIQMIDNSLSLIAGQKGKCFVTKEPLTIGNMECHHKRPKMYGGTDDYNNLVWLKTEIHKLVHSTRYETINKYMMELNLDKLGLKRLNTLRKLVGNPVI